MTHLLAFLLGWTLHAAYLRWRRWERGVDLEPARTFPLDPKDPSARFYPPGTSWSWTADPPDPRTVDLASYPDRYAETHGS